MGLSKLSVTIPEEIYKDIKAFAAMNNVKISHLVAEALAEKAKRLKDEVLLQKINEAVQNAEIDGEQKRMAEIIAETMDVEELPW